MELTFPFHRRKREIESIALNDLFTPFGGVKKDYDGSVALYIDLICDSAIPKCLSDPGKNALSFFVFFFSV